MHPALQQYRKFNILKLRLCDTNTVATAREPHYLLIKHAVPVVQLHISVLHVALVNVALANNAASGTVLISSNVIVSTSLFPVSKIDKNVV